MRRAPAVALLLALAGVASSGEDAGRPKFEAVAATNGVVVHGVDSKLLAARVRDVDRKVLAGDVKGAATDLAEILAGDASALLEETGGAYLGGREACLQRIAALPPDGVAAYRATVDARAASVLAEALARGDVASLARHASAMALSSHGPKMLVALADMRAARGDARLAAQALSDLLRLWPETGATSELPGVDRAAVVLRLGSLLASLGDEDSIWWLARETSPTLLAAPSPGGAGGKLADDLDRCAKAAAARDAPPPGPVGEMKIAAQASFASELGSDRPDARQSREIDERPIPIGTPERPVLLTRETRATRPMARVVALAPDEGGGRLVPLWTFPSFEEAKAALRRGGRGPFAPARMGDLVLFPWPIEPTAPTSGAAGASPDDEQNTLPVLSIAGEGRLVDERGGDDEKTRDDGDPELVPTLNDQGEIVRPALSFCGRPLVVGTSVFTTLVRRTDNGGATELHLARFDVVVEGASPRLRLRWRRHVLDGESMRPARYATENAGDVAESLTAPSSPAESLGRVYVGSNTGAVACLDGADGRVLWVQAYQRFGPSPRFTILPAVPRTKTWDDVPMTTDGPYVWAAPSDAEHLIQFRGMPRAARSTLVESWPFSGGAGTSAQTGRLLANFEPDKLVGVSKGIGRLAGGPPRGDAGPPLLPGATPLVAFRLRDALPGEPRRAHFDAQIPAPAAFGAPCLVAGALLFPSAKGVFRVRLDDFEGAPSAAWTPTPPSRPGGVPPDQIGNLVPDGARLWSVTPHRAVLFEATSK